MGAHTPKLDGITRLIAEICPDYLKLAIPFNNRFAGRINCKMGVFIRSA
jgi:hypothetical protein